MHFTPSLLYYLLIFLHSPFHTPHHSTQTSSFPALSAPQPLLLITHLCSFTPSSLLHNLLTPTVYTHSSLLLHPFNSHTYTSLLLHPFNKLTPPPTHHSSSISLTPPPTHHSSSIPLTPPPTHHSSTIFLHASFFMEIVWRW